MFRTITGPKCEAQGCVGRVFASKFPPDMPGFDGDHYYECCTCGAKYDDAEFDAIESEAA